MPRYYLPLLLGAVLARSASAQTSTATVYPYVEQMPTLAGSSGAEGIRQAIYERLGCPPEAVRTKVAGPVTVRFVVTEKGDVTGVEVVKQLAPGVDAALVAAVKKLPRFAPGRQNGAAVKVYETIPLLVNCGNGPVPGHTLPEPVYTPPPPDSSKVYTYIETPPALPGTNGTQSALIAAIQQRLGLPAGAPAGRVFVSFTVGPHGSAYNPEIIKSLSPEADAAVLTAVRQLPRFTPGRQNGRAVAFSFTLPILVGAPGAGGK